MSRSKAIAIRHRAAAAGAALLVLALSTAAPAGAAVPGGSSQIFDLVNLDGYTLFELRHDTSASLWRTDGTAQGTFRLAPAPAEPTWFDTTMVGRDGGVAYVAVVQDFATDLWRTDGTVAGTRRLTDLGDRKVIPIEGEGWADSLGRLFFFVFTDGEPGRALWTSDGTAAGTGPVGVPIPTGANGLAFYTAEVPGAMLIQATNPTAGQIELWRSNGESTGTFLLGADAGGG
ncbi:MAG TPA: hypothetical protein VKU40_05360, partial [Thermoanaerobaculia bacterium]|nr:hypothetical protein [Thermoanaerobaculia bacterium]